MTIAACHPGFYCPQGSAYATSCPKGHYCEQDTYDNGTIIGCADPIKCPLGYKTYDNTLHYDFVTTCEPCQAGYYGNHPDRTRCRPCRAGVVCKDKATTDQPLVNSSAEFGYARTRSYPCPVGEKRIQCSSCCIKYIFSASYRESYFYCNDVILGYYCPRKSSEPLPCPAGTYNPFQFGKNLKTCSNCPTSHFQYKTSQPACFACGEESSQENTGQTSCTCNFANRDFQVSGWQWR